MSSGRLGYPAMTGDKREVLEFLFAIKGNDWLDGPDIQREFTRAFGNPYYRSTMDDFRRLYCIEHEYHQNEAGKKYWRYRRVSSPSNAGGAGLGWGTPPPRKGTV